jgi:inorganic phosphate transporter, PiT family
MLILLVVFAFFLAFSNGANDNFKGFATVWGSASLSYRWALILSTAATFAGGITSILLSDGLIKAFSGKGLVPDLLAGSPNFALAVATAAGLTVIAATRLGFPISTTHALVGGLVGTGLASGQAVNFTKLGSGFVVPLLTSPLIAATAAFLIIFIARKIRSADTTPTEFKPSKVRDGIHLLSASAICFARALNDVPKLAALMLTANMLTPLSLSASVTLTMCVGGILLSRRVAETMSMKINKLDANQGISANLVTATLVLFASKLGLPVSTTHVTVGSIIGTGAASGTLDLSTVKSVLLSWVVTLPVSAGLAYTVYSLVRIAS